MAGKGHTRTLSCLQLSPHFFNKTKVSSKKKEQLVFTFHHHSLHSQPLAFLSHTICQTTNSPNLTKDHLSVFTSQHLSDANGVRLWACIMTADSRADSGADSGAVPESDSGADSGAYSGADPEAVSGADSGADSRSDSG